MERIDRTYKAMAEVGDERRRQEELKEAGRFDYTPADPIPDSMRMAMLVEEIGEVAKSVITQEDAPVAHDSPPATRDDLRSELVQVAALAVAWIEGIDKE